MGFLFFFSVSFEGFKSFELNVGGSIGLERFFHFCLLGLTQFFIHLHRHLQNRVGVRDEKESDRTLLRHLIATCPRRYCFVDGTSVKKNSHD
jgi:hypothetical protein